MVIPESDKVFRPIHYLGSKLRILGFIEETINEIDPSKGNVCDLFAGSGSVSFHLSKTRSVTAVDIQEYSRVICNSLLLSPRINQGDIEKFIASCLHSSHTRKLFWAADPLIQHEISSLTNALINSKLENLCDILEYGSIIAYEISNGTQLSKDLQICIVETLNRLAQKKISKKQSLAVRYFGGIYFSYKQSCQIDALLEEIEKSPSEFRDILLSALLSTVSECVNTIGKQFAQPINPRKSSGEIKLSLGTMVNKDRALNIFEIFQKWIIRYNSITMNPFHHRVLKLDFNDALDDLNEEITVIYADPPYTRDHYSRFYHVLETIALRDTPEISTMVLKGKAILSRGLYRSNRVQSPFCIRSKAPIAFDSLFAKSSSIGSKLVLSYSPYDMSKISHPRVVTIEQLKNLAKKYFNHFNVVSPGNFTHSKLNNSEKHLEASSVAELLIVCY
jgi:adenine-specific DNA methylase